MEGLPPKWRVHRRRAERRRVVPVLVLLAALVASACGTRVDRAAYYRSLGQQSAGASGAAEGQAFADGSVGTDGSVGAGAPVATDAGPTGAAINQPATSIAPGSPGATAGSRAGRSPSGSAPAARSAGVNVSTTEVGDTITIGMHIPLTGAAPLPMNWQDTLKVLEEYTNTEAPINGRKVKFVVEDDGYDPAKGLGACRKLADENVLFVIGHTMPAVEDACADLFGKQGIPYLMRGTYEDVVKNRPLAYFATMGDTEQGRILADYVVSRLGGASKKAAVVYQNDQTAAKASFVARLKERGVPVVAAEATVPRQPDFAATVQKLQQAGADIVFLSMPPVDAIKISVQSQGQGYHPTWLGGGTYWNYNMSLEAAGMALDGAISLSPWATIDSAACNEYKAIYAKYRPGKEPDDVGLVMWGWYSLTRAALEKAGPHLSRATLVDALNSLQYSKPFWTPVGYTATNHLGATSVAVFRGDGQAKRWRQVEAFSTGF